MADFNSVSFLIGILSVAGLPPLRSYGTEETVLFGLFT